MNEFSIESKLSDLLTKKIVRSKTEALAALFLFSAINFVVTLVIPKFGQIFRDALGPDYHLAPLTVFFLNSQTFIACLALLWPVLGIILAFKFKNIFLVKTVLVILLIVVVCQVALTLYGLSLGMVNPMTGASEIARPY
jgi:hypothetical protein